MEPRGDVIDYLAIIPARSGSAGIRDKNIRKINGKECIRYTLEPLSGSRVDKIFFSTDSPHYLGMYKRYVDAAKDITYNYLRPSAIAGRDSTPSQYIDDCLEFLSSMGHVVNNVVILQPTSLFRTAGQIDDVLALHRATNRANIKSVSPVIQTPYYMLYDDNTMVVPNDAKNRQDHRQIHIVNGAYYVFSVENYKDDVRPFTAYRMSALEGLDLDDGTDLLLIESVLKNR